MKTLRYTLFWIAHACYEWLYVLFRCPRYLPVMARFLEWSIFRSPYLAARRDPNTHGDKALTYGEITLSTVDALLEHIQAGPNDLFLDLGAGRGRIVAYAATKGIPAVGIELLPALVEIAQYATKDIPLASFHNADLRDADLTQATIIWIVGTCWPEETFELLSNALQKLTHRPIIVSVSAPIPEIAILERRMGSTSWGEDRFYIQQADPPPDDRTT